MVGMPGARTNRTLQCLKVHLCTDSRGKNVPNKKDSKEHIFYVEIYIIIIKTRTKETDHLK